MMRSQTHLFYAFSLILMFGIFCTSSEGEGDGEKLVSNIQKLREKLLKDYNSNVRPVIHHSNITSVHFGMAPMYLIDFNEDLSLFIMDTRMILIWNDPRLSWDKTEFDGLDSIELAAHLVWQPDITIYNAYFGRVDPKRNTPLLVWPDGTVIHVPPAVLTTFCPLNYIGSYPYDKIVCEIEMSSWAHHGWQIDLQLHNENMHTDELWNTNPRWEILVDELSFLRNVIKYNCCEEPYIMIHAKFPLKRRLPPEIQIVWSPCILIMALTLTMFWIPSDSGKKVVLGTTMFFSLTILTVYAGASTKAPRGKVQAALFLESTMYAVAAATIIELFVVNLCRITGCCRPPQIIVELLAGPLGKYGCIWPTWQVSIPGDRVQLKEDIENVVTTPTVKEEWLLIATAIDRILFIVFVIVFAGIHQE